MTAYQPRTKHPDAVQILERKGILIEMVIERSAFPGTQPTSNIQYFL